MRFVLSLFVICSLSSCFFSGKSKKNNPHVNNETLAKQEVLPEFEELDSDSDGVISKQEHSKAKKEISDISPLTPYFVFGSILGAIVLICGLSGIRYGAAKESICQNLKSMRVGFLNLLTKLKEKKK